MSEYDLMFQNGLLSVFEYEPSFFSSGVSESMKKHIMQTWNKPTASWSLECEKQGKTRDEALKRTTIQLTYIEDNPNVENCGKFIVLFYSPLGCCGLLVSCGTACESPVVAAYSCCIRFFWLIIGIIMIVSLSKTRDAVEGSHSRFDEFEIINECADEYAFVQIDELKDVQSEELGKIILLWTLCFAVFMMIASEICCGVIFICCHGLGQNIYIKPMCNQFCKEAAAFMLLYKVLG